MYFQQTPRLKIEDFKGILCFCLLGSTVKVGQRYYTGGHWWSTGVQSVVVGVVYLSLSSLRKLDSRFLTLSSSKPWNHGPSDNPTNEYKWRKLGTMVAMVVHEWNGWGPVGLQEVPIIACFQGISHWYHRVCLLELINGTKKGICINELQQISMSNLVAVTHRCEQLRCNDISQLQCLPWWCRELFCGQQQIIRVDDRCICINILSSFQKFQTRLKCFGDFIFCIVDLGSLWFCWNPVLLQYDLDL